MFFPTFQARFQNFKAHKAHKWWIYMHLFIKFSHHFQALYVVTLKTANIPIPRGESQNGHGSAWFICYNYSEGLIVDIDSSNVFFACSISHELPFIES